MKVAIIYNRDLSKVINQFGIQNKEIYNPQTVKRVQKALESRGHNVAVIDGNMHVVEQLQHFMPKVLEGEKMGMVFNMSYGIQGESRYSHLPAMLEMLGIPYVGSTPAGHSLALDKVLTKIIMEKHNIPTPSFWVFNNKTEDMSDVVFPVIVKPKMEAVSYGLKVVDNEADLKSAVEFIIEEFNQGALVEQFIKGREFCVGLLGNYDLEALPVLEIDLQGNPDGIQTVDNKKARPMDKICPAPLSPELAEEMIHWSKEAFRALHLRDFARVDIRMDENNNIYLLEINSMASLGKTGSYVHAASVAGHDFDSLVNRMLDVAALRYVNEENKKFDQEDVKEQNKLSTTAKVISFIRGREDNIKKLLKSMVNINTYHKNVDGVNQLGELLKKQFSQMGFHHQVFNFIDMGNTLYFSNSNNEKLDILFLAHLDNTISLSNHINFSEDEQKCYGSGIWNSKGGLAVLVSSLQTIRFLRFQKKINIGILLTSDNSRYGKHNADRIKTLSDKADHIISFSGGSLDGSVVTSRSGAGLYRIFMNMKNASGENQIANGVKHFNRCLASISDMTDAEEGLVIIPSFSELSSNISGLSTSGKATISIRLNKTSDMEILDKKIRKIISTRKPANLNYSIDGGLKRPPMQKKSKDSILFDLIKSNAQKLDIRVIDEHRWSSNDIGYVSPEKQLIDGLGPVGSDSANGVEFILWHSLIERSKLLAMMLISISEIKKDK